MSVQIQGGALHIFMSHVTWKQQIPIDRSANVHSAELRKAGDDVTDVEFDGPHAYHGSIVRRSVDFFLADPAVNSDSRIF